MEPTISSLINYNTKQLTVTDTFNYGSLLFGSAFGNVTAKIGNTIFHSNDDFDSNADIVVGTNNSITIDLPVSGGKIQEGNYQIIYDLLINYISNVTAPGSASFSSIVINPSSAQFITQVQGLITQFGTPTIKFKNNSGTVLGTSTITGTSGSATIQFTAVNIASFATIASIEISQEYQLTEGYTFSNCEQVSGSLNVNVNCAAAQITVKDTTAYPAYIDTLTRQLTLRYPRLADGTEVESPVTTSEPSLTVGPYIWSGGYTIVLESVLNWNQDDGLLLQQTLTLSAYPNVQCDAALCKAFKCIESLRVKYMNALKSGDRNVGALTQQNFIVSLMCNSYQIAVGCNDTPAASKILTELITYLNDETDGGCNCGCSGPNDSEPTKILPLYTPESFVNGLENSIDYQ